MATARRFTKTNYQKNVLFLAIFADFCPVRRSHWKSWRLQASESWPKVCLLKFPKKVPKFKERVNRWAEKSALFRSRHCQPSVPLVIWWRSIDSPQVLPRPSRRRAFIRTKAFRDCVYWFGMVSFHQDRSCHVDVQKLSANPRCGPCPIVKFCVYILQDYLCRKDHLNCSHLLCHCVFFMHSWITLCWGIVDDVFDLNAIVVEA